MRSWQTPLQSVWPAGQTHFPPTHLPPMHCSQPHPLVATHLLPAFPTIILVRHEVDALVLHPASLSTFGAAAALAVGALLARRTLVSIQPEATLTLWPHKPQCSRSVAKSGQAPSSHWSFPVLRQRQRPPTQSTSTDQSRQTRSHLPQWNVLVCKSAHSSTGQSW